MKALFIQLTIWCFGLSVTTAAFAQQTKPDDKYTRMEVMIPMRDGLKLHTVIFTPKESSEKLPFLMLRTPYGVNEYPSPEKYPYIQEMGR